jgi:hypothetical protein
VHDALQQQTTIVAAWLRIALPASEFDGPVALEGSRAGSPPRIGHVSYCDYVIWPRTEVRGIVRIKATM